jgi:hypothetical protein
MSLPAGLAVAGPMTARHRSVPCFQQVPWSCYHATVARGSSRKITDPKRIKLAKARKGFCPIARLPNRPIASQRTRQLAAPMRGQVGITFVSALRLPLPVSGRVYGAHASLRRALLHPAEASSQSCCQVQLWGNPITGGGGKTEGT